MRGRNCNNYLSALTNHSPGRTRRRGGLPGCQQVMAPCQSNCMSIAPPARVDRSWSPVADFCVVIHELADPDGDSHCHRPRRDTSQVAVMCRFHHYWAASADRRSYCRWCHAVPFKHRLLLYPPSPRSWTVQNAGRRRHAPPIWAAGPMFCPPLSILIASHLH
jgi:hypothetical protein